MSKESRFKVFIVSLFVSLMVFGSQAFADVVSLQTNFVAGDADVVTHLNNDRTALTNGVNNVRGVFAGSVQSSGQIKADTVGEENMADDANSRIRTAEGASCTNFTYTGLLPATTTGTLVGSVPAGTGYPLGYRVVKSGATAHTFNSQKWTWVDMDIAGSFTFLEQAIGTAAPGVTANSMRLARVSTDTTQIGAVQDLRVTSCSTGPFSNFADAAGESTLSDVLVYGNNGWLNGLNFVSYDNTNVTVYPGTAYINGEYRTLTNAKQISIAASGNSLTGVDGIDAGAVGASTTYYLYATADIDSTKTPIFIYSTNANTPAGPTKFRKIGEAVTDASSTFASGDVTSINYMGKIRQVKRFETGAVATGTTSIPYDTSIPQITEGDQYMSLSITPVNANDMLKIDVVTFLGGTPGADHTVALFQDNNANAIAAGHEDSGGNNLTNISFSHKMVAGTTALTTFKVRCGNGTGATETFNGTAGAGYFNGRLASSITVTEYEQ